MEKFKIYSNDPYDFDEISQIKDFFTIIKDTETLAKLKEKDANNLYIKVLADQNEKTVEVTLMEKRKSSNPKIKLPDLVVIYHEFKLKDCDQFLDMSEYVHFE